MRSYIVSPLNPAVPAVRTQEARIEPVDRLLCRSLHGCLSQPGNLPIEDGGQSAGASTGVRSRTGVYGRRRNQ